MYKQRVIISNPFFRSLVIQAYLNDRSYNQIAKEVGVFSSNAFNIIKDWKYRIGIPNVEELRDFAVAVKK